MALIRFARIGVSLRWRLVRNRLRKGGLVLFVVVLVLCAVGAVSGFAVFAAARVADTDQRRAVVVVFTTLVIVGWTFLPLVAGGADETVDPTRLALLPLRRTELLVLLAASASSAPATLAVAFALSGIVVGYAPAGPGALVTLLAVPVIFLLGLGTARSVSAALARAQRSRRGRDVAVVVTALVGVTIWIVTQLVGPVLAVNTTERGRRIVDVLAWLPMAWPARAVLAASDGHPVAAVAWLATSAMLAAGALRLWVAITDGLLQRGTALAPSPRLRGAALGGAVTPGQAARAKERRYLTRSPGRRVQFLMGTVMGCALVAIQAINIGRHSRTVFLGLAASLFGVSGAFNVIGFDSASLWLEHVSGGLRRHQLAARSLSWLPGAAAACIVAIVGLVAWTGEWRLLPALLLAAAGTTGIGLAIGLVVSVIGPLPVEDGQNPFAWRGANGANLVVGLATFGGLVAMAVFSAPYVVPMLVWVDSSWVTALGVVGALWGWAWWWVALRFAAARIDGRGPDLITRLSPRAVS